MRCPARLLALTSLLLVFVAVVAAAQSIPPPILEPAPADALVAPLSPDRDAELTKWLKAMEEWRRYDARWYNRPVRDSLGRATARRPAPDPPEWLGTYCADAAAAGLLDLDARTATACLLHDDPRAPIRSASLGTQAARDAAETQPKRWSFLTRVHLDGLWSTAATTGRSYGLIGSHVSLVDIGRIQVFGPPGVLLLSVPEADGSRRITLGYTWGLSIRLTDVRLFGTKDMTLFANVSKVWIAGNGGNGALRGEYEIAGFSVAPRKKRR